MNRQQQRASVQREIAKWDECVSDFLIEAEEKSDCRSQELRNQFARLWQKVQADWETLEDASQDSWHTALEELETSLRKLRKIWHEAELEA
jgi:hypothetical protein